MNSLTPAQIAGFAEKGYLVLDSGLSDAEVAALKGDTLSVLADVEPRMSRDPRRTEGCSRFRDPIARARCPMRNRIVSNGICEPWERTFPRRCPCP